jgi:hypothetical protein
VAGYPLEAPLEFIERDALRHQLEVDVIGLADVTKMFLPLFGVTVIYPRWKAEGQHEIYGDRYPSISQ